MEEDSEEEAGQGRGGKRRRRTRKRGGRAERPEASWIPLGASWDVSWELLGGLLGRPGGLLAVPGGSWTVLGAPGEPLGACSRRGGGASRARHRVSFGATGARRRHSGALCPALSVGRASFQLFSAADDPRALLRLLRGDQRASRGLLRAPLRAADASGRRRRAQRAFFLYQKHFWKKACALILMRTSY